MSKSVDKASSLYGFSLANTCSEEVAGSKVLWPFKITRELDTDEKSFYFSASSQLEMQDWITALNKQIDIVNCGRNTGRSSFPGTLLAARARLPSPDELGALSYDTCSTSVAKDSNDSDYEEIIEEIIEENRTDESKTRTSQQSPTVPSHQLSKLSAQMSPPFNPSGPSRNPFTKPAVQPKPLVSLMDEMKSVGLFTRKSSQGEDDPECCEPAEYIGGGEYVVDCKQPTSHGLKSWKTEEIADKAFWSKSPDDGERLMKSLSKDGAYMLRDSKDSMSQTLLVRTDNIVRKFRINKNERGEFSLLADGPWFPTRSALIVHYRTNCLPKLSDKLTKPWSEVNV